MRHPDWLALMNLATALLHADAQGLDPIKNLCARFDHQCKCCSEILGPVIIKLDQRSSRMRYYIYMGGVKPSLMYRTMALRTDLLLLVIVSPLTPATTAVIQNPHMK